MWPRVDGSAATVRSDPLEPKSEQSPQRNKSVARLDLLAFRDRPRAVRDRHFRDREAAADQLRRNLMICLQTAGLDGASLHDILPLPLLTHHPHAPPSP